MYAASQHDRDIEYVKVWARRKADTVSKDPPESSKLEVQRVAPVS